MRHQLRLLWKTLTSLGVVAAGLWAVVIAQIWWASVSEGLTVEKVIGMSPMQWSIVTAITIFSATIIGSYRVIRDYDLDEMRRRQTIARTALRNLLGVQMRKGRDLLVKLEPMGMDTKQIRESGWEEEYKEWDKENFGLIEFGVDRGRAEVYANDSPSQLGMVLTYFEGWVKDRLQNLAQLIRDIPGIDLSNEFIKANTD